MRLTIEYLYNTKYICNQLTAEISLKLHRMGCLLMSFKIKVYTLIIMEPESFLLVL